MTRRWGLIAIMLVMSSCGFGSSTGFTLTDARVDSGHACASGASNAPYDLHGAISTHNGTSSSVSITSISAAMTLATVHGGWLEQAGYRYDVENLTVSPRQVGPGASASLQVTIPSACTNLAKTGGPLSYGDYSVAFTVSTSAGTFKIGSTNRHRIIAS